MRDFKRILISVGVVVIVFTLVSASVIEPYLNSNRAQYFCDIEVRNELAGSVDFLVVGSSEGLVAFDPDIMDKELSVHSYNLCGSLMTLGGTETLLRKELSRNPVKTVILEFSPGTLAEHEVSYESGDVITLRRLDSFAERWDFMLKHMDIDEWIYAYSNFFIKGIEQKRNAFLGYFIPNPAANQVKEITVKGAYFKESKDIRLSEKEADEEHDLMEISVDYPKKNIEEYERIIDLCKSYGAKVTAVYVMTADSYIWRIPNLDEFDRFAESFFEEHGCDFYNMNLCRNRYELFSDQISYNNELHMSREGAAAFTLSFSDILKKTENGVPHQELFFRDYEELKEYSPYKTH